MDWAANLRGDEFRALVGRLRSVSDEPRKLLTQIVELIHSGPVEREADTAYVPEILESCGLDVDHMYSLVAELERAKLVTVRKDYPFETVKVSSGDLLNSLWALSRARQSPLFNVLVGFRFELLGLDGAEGGAPGDTDFLVKLGEDIRSARTRLGMTRKMLAKESGVSERFLAQVEGGSGNASVLVLRQIASALKVPLQELIAGEANGADAQVVP